MLTAGQATPTISYIMSDLSDNTTRMYPQALLKQFTHLSTTPQWDEYDITASFNTEMDWHFINDPNPISSNQTDFLRTVVHELIHGLGFMSSWGDNLYQSFSDLIDNLDHFITPALLASDNDSHILDGDDTPQPFWGFVEYPLDKFIYYDTDHTNASESLYPFTTITKRLNQWCNANALFRSSIDMANSWYNSEAFQHAKRIYGRSVKDRDVMAAVNNTPVLYLETSLNPFSAGSSLSHVDRSQYISSAEYLMVYTANRGVSVETLEKKYPIGPIGPKLMTVMASLGYFIDSSFNITTQQPQIVYWSPPDGLVKTDSNKDPPVTIDQNGPAHSPLNSSTPSLAASTSAYYTSSAYRIEYQCYLHAAIFIILVTLLIR
ncbi:hypothetical protein K501DRAFT_239684 [Backusella circina FSU 941]|nr:hypothetical protein K501DRAFT_239684 [Backusella circina FSU 941]